MLRAIVIVCAAALALAACSSDDPEPSENPDHDPIASTSSILEKLTGQKMCDLLDDDAVEKAVDNTVNGGKVRHSGKLPITLNYHCSYNTEGIPSISTDLSTTEPDESDQEVLDGVFTDLTEKEAGPGEYEKVTGVGTLAGLGPDSSIGDQLNAWEFGVVATVADERILLTISVFGQRAEQAPMKSLAQELLTNLESAVR
jgi:hypothetical protein